MSDSNNSFGYLRLLALISQLGLSISLPIILGLFLGRYLEDNFAVGRWATIVLMLLGVFAGLQGAYRMVMRAIKQAEDQNS